MKSNVFYVYEHWRPDKDICFYVGKGKGHRAYITWGRNNTHYDRVVKKLARLGMCVEVRLVASALTEYKAFDLEIERIAFWKSCRVELVNKTNGGEGISGFRQSVEHRAYLSKIAKGRKHSEKTKKRMSLAHSNRQPCSDATRKKLSESLSKVYQSKELRALLGNMHRNKTVSEETRAKLREKRKLQILPPKTEEHRRKLSVANRGQKRSEKTKERLRKAWELRRQKLPNGISEQTRKNMSIGACKKWEKVRQEKKVKRIRLFDTETS